VARFEVIDLYTINKKPLKIPPLVPCLGQNRSLFCKYSGDINFSEKLSITSISGVVDIIFG